MLTITESNKKNIGEFSLIIKSFFSRTGLPLIANCWPTAEI